MKPYVLLVASLLACSSDYDENGINLIKEIESDISLPKKINGLEKYHRYCFNEQKELNCVYILEETENITFVKSYKDLPEIMDGGCDVINLKYDKISKNVEYFFCNGDA